MWGGRPRPPLLTLILPLLLILQLILSWFPILPLILTLTDAPTLPLLLYSYPIHFSHCSDHPDFGPKTRTAQNHKGLRRCLHPIYPEYQIAGGNCDMASNFISPAKSIT